MKLDSLGGIFSEFIRRRAIIRVGGCERCLTTKRDWKELQCSHFIGRSRKSVRFDEANAIGLCGACHLYLTAHPLEHVEFFSDKLGDEYDLLLSRSRIIHPKPDKKMLTLYYQEKIRELDDAKSMASQ